MNEINNEKKNIITSISPSSIITGNETLYIIFYLNKNKTSCFEEIVLEDFSNAENRKTPHKQVTRKKFVITDDLNEKIKELKHGKVSKSRIGITLANLLNKIVDTNSLDKKSKLQTTLADYISYFRNFDNEFDAVKLQIQNLIKKYNITTNELLSNEHSELYAYLQDIKPSYKDTDSEMCSNLIHNLSNDSLDNKETIKTLRFLEEVFNIKSNIIINNYDLFELACYIVNNYEITYTIYRTMLYSLLEELRKDLSKLLNKTLQAIIGQNFKQFYLDYYFVNEPYKIYDFKLRAFNNYKENKYCTYYKLLYEYMLKIENTKESDRLKRFKKFSLSAMFNIFLESINADIHTILLNYPYDLSGCSYDSKLKEDFNISLANVTIVEDNVYKCKLSSFNELLCYTKYFLNKLNKFSLRICDLCSRYYITQGNKDEKACNRRMSNNDKYTCSEYYNVNSRNGNSVESQIQKEKKSIESLLDKRFNDKNKLNIQKEKFRTIYRKIYDDNSVNDILPILEKLHQDIKNNKQYHF